jgi:hypothetical protein
METDTKTIDLILKKSKEIQDVLNNVLLDKFIKLHNIPKEYSKFHAKQEIIGKRAHFLEVKKKYALWIANKEGVPVEEFEEKGLVTRRSDYPSFTKEKIKKIFDMLLKEDKISFKKISTYIEETSKEIQSLIINGDKTVARPVKFSKELATYIKIPYQVLGMQLWNRLEYKYFVPGSKGYCYRITGIDPYLAPSKIQKQLRKIEEYRWLVLPYEEEKLPNYYKIDVEEMLDFAWSSRIEELLRPILHKINKKSKIEKQSLVTF